MPTPSKPAIQRGEGHGYGNKLGAITLKIPDLHEAQRAYDEHKAKRPAPLPPDAPKKAHQERQAWLSRDEFLRNQLAMAKAADMNRWNLIFKAEEESEEAPAGSGAWQKCKTIAQREEELRQAREALDRLAPHSSEWLNLRSRIYTMTKKLKALRMAA